MKDASKRFFDIAGSHPNALPERRLTINRRLPTLSEDHGTYYFDSPDALAAVDSLNDVNDTRTGRLGASVYFPLHRLKSLGLSRTGLVWAEGCWPPRYRRHDDGGTGGLYVFSKARNQCRK
ncbi:hypothetical protein EVAR_83552_1 [Eumeta japonica]|uniref:Uncharacterized protein n=1 Tax=Eumeta variegata TaxID=151549 RepID=A0A4C2A7X0_EUMVA|nr:hypothetical protein EVAR_83552_1 [Eumeta japonica]